MKVHTVRIHKPWYVKTAMWIIGIAFAVLFLLELA